MRCWWLRRMEGRVFAQRKARSGDPSVDCSQPCSHTLGVGCCSFCTVTFTRTPSQQHIQHCSVGPFGSEADDQLGGQSRTMKDVTDASTVKSAFCFLASEMTTLRRTCNTHFTPQLRCRLHQVVALTAPRSVPSVPSLTYDLR